MRASSCRRQITINSSVAHRSARGAARGGGKITSAKKEFAVFDSAVTLERQMLRAAVTFGAAPTIFVGWASPTCDAGGGQCPPYAKPLIENRIESGRARE